MANINEVKVKEFIDMIKGFIAYESQSAELEKKMNINAFNAVREVKVDVYNHIIKLAESHFGVGKSAPRNRGGRRPGRPAQANTEVATTKE
jgi:hypothetical protein